MDVIANNIANVNTVGYKTSRVTFKDVYSETIAPATAPTQIGGVLGGKNAMQVGLGVTLNTIDIIFTRAPAQLTNRTLDLAIGGEGFFVVQNAFGTKLYTRAGNFYTDKEGYLVTGDGMYVLGYVDDPPGPDAPNITDFDDLQFINLRHPEADDDPPQAYSMISIDSAGVITALDSRDGEKYVLGQIALALFDNVDGLQKVGNNKYIVSNNSGPAQFTIAAVRGAGEISPSALEMSNVDLANEFSDMIVTQRGFQANSRVITVSDTMLEELVNLKR